ncbi:hypothetical protein SynBIOSE41_02924 [Synechococcus sp. BIOS-E4-1]|nr:hypothetical protein SynBIOSE41_02924 [Synechococcus sp. BIOS-E4-1]
MGLQPSSCLWIRLQQSLLIVQRLPDIEQLRTTALRPVKLN